VFCVDEKIDIQALDRLDPVPPLSPGRMERHGFEYKRNGKTAARDTSAQFVQFLGQVVSGCKPKQEIHIIFNNLSAHKTQKVKELLDSHPSVKLRFTPRLF
jgi:hypothetical protein